MLTEQEKQYFTNANKNFKANEAKLLEAVQPMTNEQLADFYATHKNEASGEDTFVKFVCEREMLRRDMLEIKDGKLVLTAGWNK